MARSVGSWLLILTVAGQAERSVADTFGSGDLAFEIPFVTIDNPGNPPDPVTPSPNSDPLPSGRVDYVYRIGQFEVHEDAVQKANAASELSGDTLGITLDDRGPNKPATGLTWFEAARFVNWLNADQGFASAYKFDASGEYQLWSPGDVGYNASNPFRNSRARYALPSADEWHKAAFYNPSNGSYFLYPIGSDEPPRPVASGTDPNTAVYNQLDGPADVYEAGGASPFGVVGQAGNVWEWEETAADLLSSDPHELRGIRGSEWVLTTSALGISSAFRQARHPEAPGGSSVGIRIVRLPEPSGATIACLLIAGGYSQRMFAAP